MVVGVICVGIVFRVWFEMRAHGGATLALFALHVSNKSPCLQWFTAPTGVR